MQTICSKIRIKVLATSLDFYISADEEGGSTSEAQAELTNQSLSDPSVNVHLVNTNKKLNYRYLVFIC